MFICYIIFIFVLKRYMNEEKLGREGLIGVHLTMRCYIVGMLGR